MATFAGREMKPNEGAGAAEIVNKCEHFGRRVWQEMARFGSADWQEMAGFRRPDCLEMLRFAGLKMRKNEGWASASRLKTIKKYQSFCAPSLAVVRWRSNNQSGNQKAIVTGFVIALLPSRARGSEIPALKKRTGAAVAQCNRHGILDLGRAMRLPDAARASDPRPTGQHPARAKDGPRPSSFHIRNAPLYGARKVVND